MKRILIVFMYFVCSLHLFAGQYNFRMLGCMQGLSQSSAISIWQDQVGRMWLGNDVLNCYNGENIRIYRLSEYFKEVEDANIHNICGNDSVLYLLAEDQLVYMDMITEEFTLPGIRTSAIYSQGSDLFYVARDTFWVYNCWSDKSQALFSFPEKGVITTCLLPDGKDCFLIGTTAGVYRINYQSGKLIDRTMENETMVCLFEDSHKNIWMADKSGRIYIREVGKPFQLQSILNNSGKDQFQGDKFCFEEDAAGTIWLGTLNGVYALSRSETVSDNLVLQDHILPISVVFALCLDKQGTLWVGSYYGDVCYFNPQVDKYVLYTTDEEDPAGLHGVVQGDMTFDNAGTLYVSTEGSGINVLSKDRNVIDHLNVGDGLPTGKIREVWYDDIYNRLFISPFMNGLYYMTPGSRSISRIEAPILSTANRLVVEKLIPYKNDLLLLTQDGIFKMDRKSLQITDFFTNPELQNLCSGILRAIYIDERDVLWVSSFRRGLFTINLRTQEVIRMYGNGLDEESVVPSAVVDICGNKKYGMYLATLKSGVMSYIVEKDSFIRFTEQKSELLSNVCNRIALSKYGTLVVTSSKGISFVNLTAKREFKSVFHTRLTSFFPLTGLGTDCGLYASQEEDMIIVGGLYGLLFFKEKDLVAGSNSYALHFSSISINGKPVSSSSLFGKELHCLDKLVLPYNKNTLSLTFASSDYLLPLNAVAYEYKLDGLDEYWTRTEHRTITYNSLRPGDYHLVVREVRNPDKVVSLSLHIKPPFWWSYPALLCYVVLGCLLVWRIIYFNKSKAMLRFSLEMERREVIRVEEVNRKKMAFFTNISNEFRTPLTLIVTLIDRLEQDLAVSGKGKIEKVKSQISRLLSLLSELTDFQKMEHGSLILKVNSYDMDRFLEELHSSYAEYAAGKQIQFKYNSFGDNHYLWYDQVQMQKVFYNVLSEVFKWTGEKEKVQLTLVVKQGWTDVLITTPGSACEPTEYDRVIRLLKCSSISESDAEPIQDIGLAFSKGILELHKGTVQLVRENGQIQFILSFLQGNSHFSTNEISGQKDPLLPLPMIMGNVLLNEIVDNDIEIDATKKRFTMLLVEGDDQVRHSMCESFSLIYDVVEQTDCMAGYEYAVREIPDIIVCEICLPGISGMEMCQMLKSNINTLHIPIILVTLKPSSEQKKESIRCGADDYIVKPFNMEMLFLRCNSLVRIHKNILHGSMKSNQTENMELVTNQQDQEFMEAANRIAESNWNNNSFDTSFWSRELGISRTRLFTRLKSITGMTPSDYLLTLKMDKAMHLFDEDPSRTVADVAYQMGFANPAYFSKYFKKQYGVTPQDYKKKKGKG